MTMQKSPPDLFCMGVGCFEAATKYIQQRHELLNLCGERITVEGLRVPFCDSCAPADALPIATEDVAAEPTESWRDRPPLL